jgi:hypothetical protein
MKPLERDSVSLTDKAEVYGARITHSIRFWIVAYIHAVPATARPTTIGSDDGLATATSKSADVRLTHPGEILVERRSTGGAAVRAIQ